MSGSCAGRRVRAETVVSADTDMHGTAGTGQTSKFIWLSLDHIVSKLTAEPTRRKRRQPAATARKVLPVLRVGDAV